MKDVRFSVVTPPPVDAVTLQEIWTHLRLDPDGSPPSTPDDAMLQSFMRDATEYVEQVTRRALVQQTVAMTMSRFPGYRARFGGGQFGDRFGGRYGDVDDDDYYFRDGKFELLRPPVQSVTRITYYDGANAQQTVDPATYMLINVGDMPASVEVLDGQAWPETYCREDAVTITYVAGYAAPVTGSPPEPDYRANVPDAIKTAMKLRVQLDYDPVAVDKADQIQKAIDRKLASLRVSSF